MELEVHRSTTASILLLIGGALFAAISVATHTRFHPLSKATMVIGLILGFLALIKVLGNLAPHLPTTLSTIANWLHSLVFELLAVFFLTPALRLFTLSKAFYKPLGQGKPILLVHGYCKRSYIWYYLRKKLADEGHVYTIDLGAHFRSMDDYALRVKSKMEQIACETGRSDIILIGHSMGGLIAALVATQCKEAAVITIASPFAGTHAAAFAPGPNGKQMRRNSEFLLLLEKKMAEQKNGKFFHIGTKTDQIVIPSHSSLRKVHPEQEYFFDDLGHTSLLYSPRVAAILTHWINTLM